jgi:hypothetical protein
VTEPLYVFVIGPDTSAEMVLFAASIGRSLARGCEVRFVDEEPERLLSREPALARLRMSDAEIPWDRARLILCGDAEPVHGGAAGSVWRLSIVTEPVPSVRLETEGIRQGFPLVMSSSIVRRFGRNLGEVPRILVAITGEDNRRERMLGRACEELAGRRWPHALAVIAPSVKAARGLEAAEVYVHPQACELAALIASSTLVLDTVEGDDAPSPVSCLASSVGVPVVTHATSLLVRHRCGELRPVAEWSPDAFAEAVIASAASAPADLAWGAELDAVAEDFGRVLRRA